MVADALAHHPTVSHYLRFIATTLGRDKLLRAVQYFARFYAWYLLRTNAPKPRITPWDATKRQLGLTRKILRVGKNIEHLKAAAAAASAPSPRDAFLRFASIGRQVGYAGYLTLDALTVPDAAGIRRWDAARTLQSHAYRFWAAGLLFSLASQVCAQYRLGQREARIDRKDGEGVVEAKRISFQRSASRLQLISDLCDLTIPSSALGWVGFDDGFVGLAGTLSSLIGVYGQWKKTA